MVKHLNTSVLRYGIQGVFLMLMFAMAGPTLAEQFTDPTRPPDSLGFAQPSAGSISSGPILQSVLISPQRKVAIISGKTVKVGDKFGDSYLDSITETEVVLRNGKNLKTLKLFPDVQKRLTANGTSARPDRRQ